MPFQISIFPRMSAAIYGIRISKLAKQPINTTRTATRAAVSLHQNTRPPVEDAATAGHIRWSLTLDWPCTSLLCLQRIKFKKPRLSIREAERISEKTPRAGMLVYFHCMRLALAFDVYGTLADTAGIARALSAHTEDPALFAARWRDKQLEYTFRRALMRRYAPFSECTADALDAVCADLNSDISPAARANILLEYRRLPAFADARPALEALPRDSVAYAFSNGEAAAVREVLGHAGLIDFFAGVVSVEDICLFKPAPEVYAHFLKIAGSEPNATWLISGNPFDIMGARAAGWNAAWVRRGKNVFGEWAEQDLRPTAVISSLGELPDLLA